MPEAWQLLACVATGTAFVTWYAWLRMREAGEAWVSAWRYWQSRAAETRATYDWWRRVVFGFAVLTVVAATLAIVSYSNRSVAMPTAAGVAVEARSSPRRAAGV